MSDTKPSTHLCELTMRYDTDGNVIYFHHQILTAPRPGAAPIRLGSIPDDRNLREAAETRVEALLQGRDDLRRELDCVIGDAKQGRRLLRRHLVAMSRYDNDLAEDTVAYLNRAEKGGTL